MAFAYSQIGMRTFCILCVNTKYHDICFQRKIGYFWPDYVQWKEFFGGMQNLSVRSWCALRPAAIGKNLKLVFNLRAGMMAFSVEEYSETNMIMLGIWLLQRFFLVVMTLGMFPSDQTLRKT